jgi:hypothetical protein
MGTFSDVLPKTLKKTDIQFPTSIQGSFDSSEPSFTILLIFLPEVGLTRCQAVLMKKIY